MCTIRVPACFDLICNEHDESHNSVSRLRILRAARLVAGFNVGNLWTANRTGSSVSFDNRTVGFSGDLLRSCMSWATKLQRRGVSAMANEKCAFSDRWLRDSAYSSWIQGGKDKGRAGCRLCCKFFDITSVGEAALKSHAKSAKLVEFVKLTANAQANTLTMRNLTDTYTP